MYRIFFSLLICAVFASAPPSESKAVAYHIVSILEQRFACAQDAAKWKWNNGLPIRNSERRSSIHYILVKLIKEGVGMNAKWADAFVDEILNQSENYQSACFKRWRREGISLFPRPVNMRKVTDPKLDALTKELFTYLSIQKRATASAEFAHTLTEACLASHSEAKDFFLPLIPYIVQKPLD